MRDDELTSDERDALDGLPRDRIPPSSLEERTVRALKERGLIRAETRTAPPRLWIAAAGIAAALAFFATGVVVGQGMGARQTVDALAAIYPGEAGRAAAQVQRTGSQHAAALAALVKVTGSAEPEDATRAREVALATLWAAASEIVRLAPEDPVAARILEELERQHRQTAETDDRSSVVWF
jgi:hypothetical protein